MVEENPGPVWSLRLQSRVSSRYCSAVRLQVRMICLWWILFKTLAVLAEAATSSGSAEANAAAANRAAANAANPGAMGGVILPQLVLLQQAPAPAGQNPVPIGPGLVAFPLLPQQQAAAPQAQGAAPQPVMPLLVLLPQANVAGNGQPAPPLQLIPFSGLNLQQGGAAAAAGKARVKHSVSNWLLRPAEDVTTVTQSPSASVSAAADF
ncbi:hypothetical protein AMEX_G10331 [Astyanax mexicanus]|uniref:Uncharacterized protein n=1 Tax=Astyanax mexicanus TaxID=7994 RepID=A0A8T2M279_ASTMX|nr:hypothetical protein AMEX_G10331 [Astyanax mexicanus]